MKLTNTPVGEAVSPRDRMRTQTVVVSIRTIASWKSALRKMRRSLRASSGSAWRRKARAWASTGMRGSQRGPKSGRPERTRVAVVSAPLKATKARVAATTSAFA